MGGEVSTESPVRTTDEDLSRLVEIEFAPVVIEDVGINVGEFGEDVPRRGPEGSRSVLAMVVDLVVTQVGTIFEHGGGIALVNVGEDIDRDIRV